MRTNSPIPSAFLFAVPEIHQGDREEIEAKMNRAEAAGLNLYHIDILDLPLATLVSLNANHRPTLILEIGEELDRRGDLCPKECSAIRTDPDGLRTLDSVDAEIVRVREWSRMTDELTDQRTKLKELHTKTANKVTTPAHEI